MLIYQPDPKERIVWHGGESTQLHYEINRGTEWKPMATTTIYDFPDRSQRATPGIPGVLRLHYPLKCKGIWLTMTTNNNNAKN